MENNDFNNEILPKIVKIFPRLKKLHLKDKLLSLSKLYILSNLKHLRELKF